MDLLWEVIQNKKINDAAGEATGAKVKVDQVYNKVVELEKRLNRITLTSQAMWELIQDLSGWSDDEILNRIQEMDLRDCQLDGKLGATFTECPNCNAKVNSRRGYCMICGTEVQVGGIFEN